MGVSRIIARQTDTTWADKPSFTETIQNFLGSALVRLVLFSVIFVTAVLFGLDFGHSFGAVQRGEQVARSILPELSLHSPEDNNLAGIASKRNLVWCAVTDKQGELTAAAHPLPAGLLSLLRNRSNTFVHQNKAYCDAVVPFKGDHYLHVGLERAPGLIDVFSGDIPKESVQVSLTDFVVALLAQTVLLLIAVSALLVGPLHHVSRACLSLLLTRDAYSDVTGGGLREGSGVSDINLLVRRLKDLRRQFDDQSIAKTELTQRLSALEKRTQEEAEAMKISYDAKLETMKQRLSEFQVKEADEEFIDSLAQELQLLGSSQQVGQRILDRLNDKFPTSLNLAAFFRLEPSKELRLEAHVGFSANDESRLVAPAHLRVYDDLMALGKPFELSEADFGDFELGDLSEEHRFKRAIYLPLHFHGRALGFLVFFHSLKALALQSKMKLLRNVVEMSSKALHTLIMLEEQTESARTDALTALKNRKFLTELLPEMLERAKASTERKYVSVLMMDADHFKEVNDTYGHQVGDEILRELAKTISSKTRVAAGRATGAARSQDYLIRYGGEEFVLVLDNASPEATLLVAERIRKAVESRTEWAAGISRVTISIGAATFPDNANSMEDLLKAADVSLYYVKKQLGRNQSCAITSVPKSFRDLKTYKKIEGSLGVFEPASLLTSLAIANKSGALLVTEVATKRRFSVTFDGGKPMEAQLGKLKGLNALIEFATTFEEAEFEFREKVGDSMTRLLSDDPDYRIGISLEHCLFQAALAQDKFDAAKGQLHDVDAEIHIPPATNLAVIRSKIDKEVSEFEWQAVERLLPALKNGQSLRFAIDTLDQFPRAVSWYAASLLLQVLQEIGAWRETEIVF
jgi:diguanylate cyclase (GGDEF)-like protein